MKINIEKNDLNFNLDSLLTLGYRANNEKRNFLFISKCLGKHLMIKPEVCRLIGYALAYQVYKPTNFDITKIKDLIEYPYSSMSEECDKIYKNKIITNESTLVLGFAETATGLGMAVASAIKDSYYITTTREPIIDMKSCFDFEETHSHATSHQCFLKDLSKLDSDRIILVDDEITTGNTMLNLIESLETNLPSKKRKYIVLSILDWRNVAQIQKFEDFKKEKGIDIEVKSLISGSIECNDSRLFIENSENKIDDTITTNYLNAFNRITHNTSKGNVQYLDCTGRFGVSENDIENIENIANTIYSQLKDFDDKKILVLGHGENIYIPARIATKFKNVEFKTTSRSPIYISDENNYPIKEKHYFNDGDVKYFFYDKSFIEKYYDVVILFTETDLNIKLCENQVTYKL